MIKRIAISSILILIIAAAFFTACYYSLLGNGELSSTKIKVPILMYHDIADNNDPNKSYLFISPQRFEGHMVSLKKAGYTTITFQAYYNYVKGLGTLPSKPIIITFDDGYLSNYQYAYPILKKLNMNATLCIVTGRMGAIDGTIYKHFTWEQAKEMQKSGVIDIQSHSMLHPDLTQANSGYILHDLEESRADIQQHLGKTADVLAYPYGKYDAKAQRLAQQAGFKMQVIIGDSGVNTKYSDLTQLRRITIGGTIDGQQLLKLIKKNLSMGERIKQFLGKRLHLEETT